MAALLPFIQDLLPMILPSEVHITRGRDLASGIPPPASHRAKAAAPSKKDKSPDASQTAPTTKETRLAKGVVENGPIELTGVSESDEASSAGENAQPDNDSPDGASRNKSPPPRPRGRGGVVVRNAIVNKTDKMCASVMFAGPHSDSAVHHNSEHDTIIYAASGRGLLATSPPENYSDDEEQPPRQQELEPGDFAFVPAWTEHQLINKTDEQVVWIVIQGGPAPIVVPLTGWGGAEAEA
ncbi:hypothetical protein PpBr36_03277 [Pyricularia pennisetigena]|uniref:hypothetical protein n=1 Tax=Pyricularia pennisetigena TaxID=1578925 RepID=UPI001150A459|nr:hypothetical protein PpBr36_03277 [Pyricularia pennisetigena]TLS30124.1 hypothetical protein PpBr36_03277 [Pyricularia pennisetigena]